MTAAAAGRDDSRGDWRLAFRLARRELRGGLRGFRIFLAALTLGVAAIAAVGSVSQSVLKGLEEDARAILGGDVALRQVHQPVSAEQRAYLATAGPSSGITDMRAMARFGTGDAGRRSLVELRAVDGAYPLYGALGTTPALDRAALFEQRDGLWGAAVEPNLLERLGIEIGDVVRVGATDFQIRAVIDNEPDRVGAAVRFFVLGPRLLIGDAALPDTGLIQPGSLIYYHYRVRLPADVAPRAWTGALDAAFPDATWRVRTLDDAAPRLQRMIERTTLFMTLVGLTALLVGGVGVANAVGAYLDGKAGVIATFKCLGAPAHMVFKIYLIQIGMLALVGIAAGVVLGALAPLAFAGAVASVLPIAARIGVFPAPLALAALFGLLTALVFSIWPVARAGQIPAASLFRNLVAPAATLPPAAYIVATVVIGAVLAGLAVATSLDPALAAWFVFGAVIALAVFRLFGAGTMALARRVRGVRHPGLRLALANLHRPGAPTASVVLSLGLGLTVLVTVALIEGNLTRQFIDELPADAPAFFFIDIQPDQVDGFRTIVAATPGVARVDDVPMLRGRVTAIAGTPAADAQVAQESRWVLRGDRGVTWSVAPPTNSTVVAGEWWPADYGGAPLISLDAETARGFGVDIGDTLTVNVLGREIQGTIANLREIDWQTLGINFVMIFSPGILEGAPRTHIATVYSAPAAEGPLERDVTDRFANVSAVRVRDTLESINRIVDNIGRAVRLTASITLVAGTLVLAGAIAAGHRRRVYDAVVLKVLGATRRNALTAFALEYGLLGLATAVIAGVLGTIAAWAVLRWIMEADWTFIPNAVIIAALGSLAVTLAFGFAGTWHAMGQKAAPLLRNE